MRALWEKYSNLIGPYEAEPKDVRRALTLLILKAVFFFSGIAALGYGPAQGYSVLRFWPGLLLIAIALAVEAFARRFAKPTNVSRFPALHVTALTGILGSIAVFWVSQSLDYVILPMIVSLVVYQVAEIDKVRRCGSRPPQSQSA